MPLRNKVYNWTKYTLSGLYPPLCALCGGRSNTGTGLCAACREELPVNVSACVRCALPLASNGLCGRCQQRPPPYAESRIPFLYAPPLDRLLLDLKFNGRLRNARLLATLLLPAMGAGESPDLLIPVPLHRQRLASRGYNQALELARPIGRALGVPVDWHSCRRLRATPMQARLDARERRRNLHGAFELVQRLEGVRHVALLDDVVTTGSTVSELSRVLLRGGVERVDVWACARAGT